MGPVAHLDDIQHRLDALARQHRVPGAVLAVSQDGELVDFATGVLSTRTGVPVTTDSVFQIGSNTKVFTATLIMQLAEAGELELDAPVRRYVPSFKLAVPGADEITIRQLLTHTSGIQGDHFTDYGRGDDAVARYVASLAELDLVHRPGQLFSYCNSGFVLAGYVAEQLTGQPYHQLLRERICDPLGLRSVTVVAEEMVAHRCAVGHVPGDDGAPVVPPVVLLGMSSAPAGSRTVATAADLVAFTRAQLDGATAPEGAPVLSAAGLRAMQEPQVTRPSLVDAPLSQGLGWRMADWDGLKVIGHGGGTIGQLSFLEAIPERGLIVALVTNSDGGAALWRDLGRWLFATLADARMPEVPRPADPAPELALDDYAGTYERLGARYEVTVADGQLVLSTAISGSIAEIPGNTAPPPKPLRPVDSHTFVGRDSDGDPMSVIFQEFDQLRPGYLFTGRAARRVTD
jgi:CubicO group peptidase (beta-lactamase class C family)